MKIISVVGARPNFMKIAPFIKSIHELNTTFSPLSGGDASVRTGSGPAEGVKSIHEVNTNLSPPEGGDASVRPKGGPAEGVNAIHEANSASISPFGGIRQQDKDKSEGGTKGVQIEHLLVHTGQHYDDRMSRAFFESFGIPEADINLGIGSGSHAEQVGNTMIAFEKVCLEEKPDWVVVAGDVNATLACSVTAKNCTYRFVILRPVSAVAMKPCPKKSTALLQTALAIYFSHPINSPTKTSGGKASPKKR